MIDPGHGGLGIARQCGLVANRRGAGIGASRIMSRAPVQPMRGPKRSHSNLRQPPMPLGPNFSRQVSRSVIEWVLLTLAPYALIGVRPRGAARGPD